jgi:hypothetical protein
MLVFFLERGVGGIRHMRGHGMHRRPADARRARGTSIDVVLELKLERLVPPVILSKGLFPLHPEIARRQGADGMLQTLAGDREVEDMLPIWIAGAVDNDDGGTDDLLVIVKEKRYPG